MKQSLIVAAFLAMSLTGCGARAQSARFVEAAPAPQDQPIAYYSARMPECAFEELGVVRGHGDMRLTSLQAVLDRMAVEARRLGGHAIIGITQSRVTDSVSTSREGESGLFGTVIRFTSPDCTS
jgi:hypothetical protein